MAIQCAWNLDSSVRWNATGEGIVGSQCVSSVPQWSISGLLVVFQCVPIMQITIGLPLWYEWALASASVVPVASQCTCCSSGLPVCSNYANVELCIATGRPRCDSISQCSSIVICPVESQCTDSICFGDHWVRSLPYMQPLMYTTGIAIFVWAKLISFKL